MAHSSRNPDAQTSPMVLGTTQVQWTLGKEPLDAQSSCLVTVGDVSLRFRTQPFNDLQDIFHKFCLKDKKYVPVLRGCETCDNCKYNTSLYPPDSDPVKCAGLTLLVDVLSSQLKLAFSVTVTMPDYNTYAPLSDLVILESDKKSGQTVIEKFFCRYRWMLSRGGTIINRQQAFESYYETRFLLSVTVYKLDWSTKLAKNHGFSMSLFPEDEIRLITRKNDRLMANKSILETQSPYFKRLLEQDKHNSRSQYFDMSIGALECLYRWMIQKKILPTCVTWIDEICKFAVLFELYDFMVDLDQQLGLYCSSDNVYELQRVAKKYNLFKALVTIEAFTCPK